MKKFAWRSPGRLKSPLSPVPNPLKRVLPPRRLEHEPVSNRFVFMAAPEFIRSNRRPASPAPVRIINFKLVAALLMALVLLVLVQLSANAQSSDEDKLQRGAQLYAENCAVCHGSNGEGRIGATLAKDWPSIRPDLTVKTIIENGVPGSPMPAWSQANGGPLSAEDIDALVFYILSWQTGGFSQVTPRPTVTARPPITPVPNVTGDPNLGARLYDQNCVMCHGPNGEGRVGASLAKVWGGIRPDLAIKTVIQNGVTGSPMPAWDKANGGPLSEGEINHLVAYILTWENSPVAVPQTAIPPAETPSPLSGWSGVIFTIVLLVVLVAAAILLQGRKQ